MTEAGSNYGEITSEADHPIELCLVLFCHEIHDETKPHEIGFIHDDGEPAFILLASGLLLTSGGRPGDVPFFQCAHGPFDLLTLICHPGHPPQDFEQVCNRRQKEQSFQRNYA